MAKKKSSIKNNTTSIGPESLWKLYRKLEADLRNAGVQNDKWARLAMMMFGSGVNGVIDNPYASLISAYSAGRIAGHLELLKTSKIGKKQLRILHDSNSQRQDDARQRAQFAHSRLREMNPARGQKLKAIEKIAADISQREGVQISAKSLENLMLRFPPESP